MTVSTDLLGGYVQTLAAHLDRPDDPTLQPYELGRRLMDEGATLLDVVGFHQRAVGELLQGRGVEQHAEAIDGFLVDVLAPFELAHLSFRDSNRALQELTRSLEEQVSQRTAALRRTVAELHVANAERRRLLERVVEAQERERRRIAEDLHDDTIQAMAAVGLRLGLVAREVHDDVGAALERLQDEVSHAIGRLRNLVFHLRPPALDREGLATAIRLYLRESAPATLAYSVRDETTGEPPARIRDLGYRITQEALVNVIKHAHATNVSVAVAGSADGLSITVVDDGVGFDTAALGAVRPGHLGVASMVERAGVVGGTCTIESEPGRGTRVEIVLPSDG